MEERDFQVFVRRAKSNPDKTGSTRRNALKQLIEATHSSQFSIQSKIFTATHIPEFFLDFPDLEEDAINAVYDLCEDQSAQVRIEGYRTLASISRLAKKWVKRNADVLVQLLQSDDPNEVNVVRKSLVEHLHMDPRVTLGVLCDQIVSPNDSADQDQEEAAMRDSLRLLVLAFISGEMKKDKGHLVKYIDDAEDVLVDALISALPRLSDSEAHLILTDILLHPSLKSLNTPIPSPRRHNLSQIVLTRAKNALAEDFSESSQDPNSSGARSRPLRLHKSLPYLSALSTLFIQRNQSSDSSEPEDLLTFYSPLIGKTVFPRISSEVQPLVLYNFAETLNACKEETSGVRRSFNSLIPWVFENLSKMGLGQERARKTCILLLQRLLRAANNGWSIPSQVIQGVQPLGQGQGLEGSDKDTKEIEQLIRSLTAKRAESSKLSSSSTSQAKMSFPSRPLSGRVSSDGGTSPRGLLSRTSSEGPSTVPIPSPGPGPSASSLFQRIRKQPPDASSDAHPAKKVKKSDEVAGEDESGNGNDDDTPPPSLLSRLKPNSNSKPYSPMHTHTHPPRSGARPGLHRSASASESSNTFDLNRNRNGSWPHSRDRSNSHSNRSGFGSGFGGDGARGRGAGVGGGGTGTRVRLETGAAGAGIGLSVKGAGGLNIRGAARKEEMGTEKEREMEMEMERGTNGMGNPSSSFSSNRDAAGAALGPKPVPSRKVDSSLFNRLSINGDNGGKELESRIQSLHGGSYRRRGMR